MFIRNSEYLFLVSQCSTHGYSLSRGFFIFFFQNHGFTTESEKSHDITQVSGTEEHDMFTYLHEDFNKNLFVGTGMDYSKVWLPFETFGRLVTF